MPWHRNDPPDPLEARRRQLVEQERLLAEQRRQLTEQLHQSGDASSAQSKRAEPPVWRMEDDSPHERLTEPTPARKANLGGQRQRDMIFVLFLVVLFLIVVGLVWWIAYVHNTAPATGA